MVACRPAVSSCRGLQVQPDNVELVRRDYAANGGWETFLAYEDPAQDILVCCTQPAASRYLVDFRPQCMPYWLWTNEPDS